MPVYRILNIDHQYELYFAYGDKNFVRQLGKDIYLIVRFLSLYKVKVDSRSQRLLELMIRWTNRRMANKINLWSSVCA